MVALPTLARPSSCWTPMTFPGKVNPLPRGAMTRTILLQPETGVEKTPFAVTRVASPSWLLPNQPYSHPTAKTGSSFGAISVYTATSILKRTTALPILRSQESRTRLVLAHRHQDRRVRQAYRGCRAMSHPCSYPPAKTRSTFSITPVVVYIAIPMMGKTTVLW